MKFLADKDSPLLYVPSKGGGDQTEHLGNFATRTVEIHNAREELPSTSLDREGFMLTRHNSAVQDFYDDSQLDGIYHGEVAELLKDVTGAGHVEVFDDTRRSSSRALQRDRGIREPANIVHNDYTADSGARRLRDFFADRPEGLQQLGQRRFAIINVWRSIAGTVADQPLVMCDATTISDEDLVSVERRAEERTGEIQVALFNPLQRWYYFPDMRSDEVLLFKTFDSAVDGRTRFTLHSSFENPSAPGDAPARESLETRCLVFF
ncbi:MAG: CmcJ/NvfI family oxidoreductase [Halioglobus sp.]|nr:CmcJ/NvfI family oxidoreductase [Halioglobus sp.]